METGTQALIGLGSNMGDRRASIKRALTLLDASPGVEVVVASSMHETAPMYVEDQPEFVNACATLTTHHTPHELLSLLMTIEQRMGRVRRVDKGPRPIDLDLLFVEGAIVDDPPELVVPHPGVPERPFVLKPLVEIAPDWVHPIFGRTMASLWEELRQRHGDQS